MSELALRKRSVRQHWAAPGGRHDRLVGIARIALPTLIGVLAALLFTAPITVGRDISFVLSKDRVAVAKERMRVTRAVYRGEDSRGQAFRLTAGSAVQATSRDPVVRLNDLAADIALEDGPATIRANSGRYDMQSEHVMIDGPVIFTGPDGYAMQTRDVGVDLNTRRVASGGPVDGRMRLGTFSANRMTADLKDRTVVLDGRARLHIVQGGVR